MNSLINKRLFASLKPILGQSKPLSSLFHLSGKRCLLTIPPNTCFKRTMTGTTDSQTPSNIETKAQTLDPQQKAILSQMLRVDQAGEIGANFIYKGQMDVLGKDASFASLGQHMWDQEKHHLKVMDQLLHSCRVRPSALRPVLNLI